MKDVSSEIRNPKSQSQGTACRPKIRISGFGFLSGTTLISGACPNSGSGTNFVANFVANLVGIGPFRRSLGQSFPEQWLLGQALSWDPNQTNRLTPHPYPLPAEGRGERGAVRRYLDIRRHIHSPATTDAMAGVRRTSFELEDASAATPSPLNGERAGVRGEKIRWHTKRRSADPGFRASDFSP